LPATREADLVDELADHLDDRYRDRLARGETPRVAARAALDELREHDAFEREYRSVAVATPRTPLRGLTGLATDVRHALRSLARRPGQTALMLLTLGVGMAGTTTVYAVVDAVVLRPLPYRAADRLVSVGLTFPEQPWRPDVSGLQALYGASVPDAMDWREQARAFDDLVPVEEHTLLLPDRGHGPELVNAASVGQGFFELFDVTPAIGRTFVASDFEVVSDAVMLVSHASWLQRYGGAADAIGRREAGITIIGVLEPGFRMPEAVGSRPAEFWLPLRPDEMRYQARGRRTGPVVGRLREGVTLDAAREDIGAVQARISEVFPLEHTTRDGRRVGAGANLLQAQTVGNTARPLFIFLGAAAMLLGIACVNAVNLLLLRGLDRRGELAVRRALGADRARLLQSLLVESVCLALGAGLLGVALAYGGVELFLRLGPTSLPRLGDVAINGRVLLATAMASVGTGVIVGLMPAIRSTGAASIAGAFGGETGFTAAQPGSRMRMTLVGAQLALATVLAVGSSLLFASFLRVYTSDVGFDPDRLSTFVMPIKIDDSTPSDRIWDDLLAEVRRVPGLDAVGGASDVPFQSTTWRPGVGVDGAEPGPIEGGYAGFIVTPGYFGVIGARVVAGREFTPADRADTEPVVVVNETFARRFLRGRAPTGARLTVASERGHVDASIVGVVADIVERRVEDGVRPAVYLPHTQHPWLTGPTVVVRSERDPGTLFPELRQAAARFNPRLPVLGLAGFADRADRMQVEPRFRAALFGAFAVTSLVLSALGLYSSLAHSVGRRRKEIGIRLALGADPRSVSAMVLRQGAAVGVLGLAAGLAGALGLTRLLGSFLYGVTAVDPVAFGASALILLGVSLAAAASPAHSAARTDVARSLRH
jgi:predicted permease